MRVYTKEGKPVNLPLEDDFVIEKWCRTHNQFIFTKENKQEHQLASCEILNVKVPKVEV